MLNAAWAVALTLAMQAASASPDRRPTAAWPDGRPITHLFQNLGDDLRSLPSSETGLIFGMGAAGALAVHGSDDNVAGWARREGASVYTPFGRVLGEGWVQTTAALGTYAAGRISGRQSVTHIGSDLIRAQLLNGVMTGALKATVDRARPSGGPHSFPSGHTSASFASAAVLQGHFGWKVGVPAYAVAGLVGWTRVRDRAHWMSDVFFGATLGTIAGRTVTRGHRQSSWMIVPTAAKGGFAVTVIKRPDARK